MVQIAGYELGKLLGKGNFGETYEATKNGQRVALKLIKEEAVQHGFDAHRFQREVRALQKAAGPNVVEIIDAGTDVLGNETRYYVALEYLEGQDLAFAFKRARYRLDEGQVKDIVTGIIAGLKTVHAQHIIHRDLKPANVFLTTNGTVKLLDFGLVRMLDYTTLTVVPGQIMGTPLYIAPEILRGEDIDWRTDFYSLGVLIYHLVTHGKYPFTALTPLELYAKVVNDAPERPMKHEDTLSSEFEDLILVLLSKQPYERTFNHDELIAAVRSTPVYVSTDAQVAVAPPRIPYAKTCYFRVLHTERTDIERFASAGGVIDGLEMPANYLPRYERSLEAYARLGIQYMFDPVTYRLAYSSFAQTEGVVNLPYVLDKDSILTVQDLQSLQALREYTKKCLDWQLQWRCSRLVSPFHFCRDLGSPWIDIDLKLIEESVAYTRRLGSNLPVYAGLCISIEPYTVKDNRMALLNRYSRTRADGYMFYVDSVNERTTNPLQLRALLDLLQLFQRLGKPVVACRVGTLGLGLLAAGVDGITNGLASLSGFSENDLLANRSVGYDMEKKYYVPKMMLTLPISLAEDILSDPKNDTLRCTCPFCRGASRNLGSTAKAHFLFQRTLEIADLNGQDQQSDRLTWFCQRVNNAIRLCDEIRSQQKFNLKTSHYSHLKIWADVFGCK